jgi:hypothetical protein
MRSNNCECAGVDDDGNENDCKPAAVAEDMVHQDERFSEPTSVLGSSSSADCRTINGGSLERRRALCKERVRRKRLREATERRRQNENNREVGEGQQARQEQPSNAIEEERTQEYKRTDKTILSVRRRANGKTLIVLRSKDRMTKKKPTKSWDISFLSAGTSSPEISALSPKGTTHTKTHIFSGLGQTRFVRRSYLKKIGQNGNDFLIRNALYHIREFCEDKNIILSPLTVPNWPFCTLEKLLHVRTTKRDCPKPQDIPRTCPFCPQKGR